MNINEHYNLLSEVHPYLAIKSSYVSNNGDKPYKFSNLFQFRNQFDRLIELDLISNEVDALKQTPLYSTSADYVHVTSKEESRINTILFAIDNKIELMLDMINKNGLIGQDDLLFIKLPKFKAFDELSRYSRDLQKAIELPITDPAIKGEVNIIGADKGSVILYVSLGTIAAVKLVAGICWSAAVIRKKNAEAKAFEEHAKTLVLKNDALEAVIEGLKLQQKNVAEAEATALANGLLNHNDPETIERLKLSMDIISNMIDKGAKILPMSKNDDIQKAFPNYNALDLIESSIRQLQSGQGLN